MARISTARPETIRSDSGEVKSIVGRQMDRIAALSSISYAKAPTESARQGVLRGMALGIAFMEANLVKDLVDEYKDIPIVKRMHEKFNRNNLNFTAGEIFLWYRTIAESSRSLLPLPRVILEFMDDDEEDVKFKAVDEYDENFEAPEDDQ